MSRCHHQVQARREEFLMFSLFYGSMSAGIASPLACTVRNILYHYQTLFTRIPFHILSAEKLPAGLTDTRRSTYVALMDKNGWWKETIRPPLEEEEEGEARLNICFPPSENRFRTGFFVHSERAWTTPRAKIKTHTLSLCMDYRRPHSDFTWAQ